MKNRNLRNKPVSTVHSERLRLRFFPLIFGITHCEYHEEINSTHLLATSQMLMQMLNVNRTLQLFTVSFALAVAISIKMAAIDIYGTTQEPVFYDHRLLRPPVVCDQNL